MSSPMIPPRPPMGGGGAPRPPMGGGGAPRPGGPPPGGPPPGGAQSKMSMFNPTDMAAKVSTGDIQQGMTVADFLQKNFGVSPNDPLEKLIEATKSQMQNRTMAGKLGVPQGPGGSPPPARPQAPTPPRGMPTGPAPRGGGLDGLVDRM
jgi:hypothetical protein